MDKLQALSKQEVAKPARKTPGVEKLLRILVPHYLTMPAQGHLLPTPSQLIEAGRRFLASPPDDEGEEKAERRAEARKEAKKAQAAEEAVRREAESLRRAARRRVWREVKVVLCVIGAVPQVAEAMRADLLAPGGDGEEGGEGGGEGSEEGGAGGEVAAEGAAAEAAGVRPFEYVMIEEAGMALEPDVLCCLLHGAKSVVLAGDTAQMPPLTHHLCEGGSGGAAPPGGAGPALALSTLARLGVARAKLGDFGGASAVLAEQHRMHEAMCAAPSAMLHPP